ncbi:MAG: hypothetical protein DRN24_01235 [Thermoplasmata archaeon]|nr:MAG: hypothetical protein DRN24_01235 [Thermoplasmata archaeon]
MIKTWLFLIFLLLLFQLTFFSCHNPVLKAYELNKYNSVEIPFDLNVGDLLFCDVKPDIKSIADNYRLLPQITSLPGYADDHVAMYIGDNKFIEATPYLYRPLKNEWLGVIITPYWFLKLWATNITFAYVDTDQKTRNAAVEWAKTQIGRPYGEKGYRCGELIFEAYKQQNLVLNFTWPPGSNISYNADYPYSLLRADQLVLYSNIPPTANISKELGYQYGNQTIYYFSAINSSDLDGLIIKYIWDFGDGTNHTGIEDFITHIYERPGKYTVTLTVVDNAEATGTETTTVLIKQEENNPSDNEDEDNIEPDQNPSDNSEEKNSSQETIEEKPYLGLLILIIMIFAIFLSIICLILVIRK